MRLQSAHPGREVIAEAMEQFAQDAAGRDQRFDELQRRQMTDMLGPGARGRDKAYEDYADIRDRTAPKPAGDG